MKLRSREFLILRHESRLDSGQLEFLQLLKGGKLTRPLTIYPRPEGLCDCVFASSCLALAELT